MSSVSPGINGAIEFFGNFHYNKVSGIHSCNILFLRSWEIGGTNKGLPLLWEPFNFFAKSSHFIWKHDLYNFKVCPRPQMDQCSQCLISNVKPGWDKIWPSVAKMCLSGLTNKFSTFCNFAYLRVLTHFYEAKLGSLLLKNSIFWIYNLCLDDTGTQAGDNKVFEAYLQTDIKAAGDFQSILLIRPHIPHIHQISSGSWTGTIPWALELSSKLACVSTNSEWNHHIHKHLWHCLFKAGNTGHYSALPSV